MKNKKRKNKETKISIVEHLEFSILDLKKRNSSDNAIIAMMAYGKFLSIGKKDHKEINFISALAEKELNAILFFLKERNDFLNLLSNRIKKEREYQKDIYFILLEMFYESKKELEFLLAALKKFRIFENPYIKNEILELIETNFLFNKKEKKYLLKTSRKEFYNIRNWCKYV